MADVIHLHPAPTRVPRIEIDFDGDCFWVLAHLESGPSEALGFNKHDDALVHAQRLRAMFGWPIEYIGEMLK